MKIHSLLATTAARGGMGENKAVAIRADSCFQPIEKKKKIEAPPVLRKMAPSIKLAGGEGWQWGGGRFGGDELQWVAECH